MSEKQKLKFQKMNETRLKNQLLKNNKEIERDFEDQKKLTKAEIKGSQTYQEIRKKIGKKAKEVLLGELYS